MVTLSDSGDFLTITLLLLSLSILREIRVPPLKSVVCDRHLSPSLGVVKPSFLLQDCPHQFIQQ